MNRNKEWTDSMEKCRWKKYKSKSNKTLVTGTEYTQEKYPNNLKQSPHYHKHQRNTIATDDSMISVLQANLESPEYVKLKPVLSYGS